MRRRGDGSVHTVASCWVRRCKRTAVRQGQALFVKRTHQQSNHLGGPEKSTVRLKRPAINLSKDAAEREGTSTLKQNRDIFCLMTAIYNRAWTTLKKTAIFRANYNEHFKLHPVWIWLVNSIGDPVTWKKIIIIKLIPLETSSQEELETSKTCSRIWPWHMSNEV